MSKGNTLQTDVAIIGYGGAGAAAAISAFDAGADVLLLEKMADGGGNTTLSTGIMIVPTGPGMVKFVEALCFGKTPGEMIRTYVDGCSKIADWIKELGGDTEVYQPVDVVYPARLPSWPNFPGVEHVLMRRVRGTTSGREKPGALLWRLLKSNVEKRGIKVLTGTPARELITNTQGEVVGIIAEQNGSPITIKVKRGVILTCGGFDYNAELKDIYLPISSTYSLGHLGNTGDGLLMAQKAGAALWHMAAFTGGFGFKAPEFPAVFSLYFHYPSFICIDKSGRRFADETGWEIHNRWRGLMVYLRQHSNYPLLPIYSVFDDAARKKGPLCGVLSTPNDYNWSLDNSKEIARGWIKQGKTIEELASHISVDALVLEKTIARYNEDCKAGRDTEWNRSRETLEPVSTPPYYAVEQWPTAATHGGPRRDVEARIVNTEGKAIPRLYSAGSLGGIWGFLNTAGGGLTEAIVFGRIAGRNASMEKPY